MSSFRAYIELIILYNCNIWTITSQAENTINAFQRRLLNTYVLNMKWPNTVRIEEVYKRTRATEWSTTIQKRRLKWFGKIIWPDDSTPAERAFDYGIAPYQRPRGKPVSARLSIIRSDLTKLNLAWDEEINIAVDIQIREAIINNFKL